MRSKTITIHNIVEGEVQSNDGEFATVQTDAVYGVEEGILFIAIEIQRDDTETAHFTSDDFRLRFPVGAKVNISTNTEITNQPGHTWTSAPVRETDPDRGDEKTSFRMVDEIRRKIVRRFPSLIDEPEHPWVPIGVVLISAELLQTTDVSKLVAFTGYSRNFVAAIAFNLIHNNLWNRDGHFGSQYRSWFSFFPDSVITNEREFFENIQVACGEMWMPGVDDTVTLDPCKLFEDENSRID